MASETKDLNDPRTFAEALVVAALETNPLNVARWLAGDDKVQENPYWKWYSYFAQKLIDLAPKPSLGFQSRPRYNVAAPKIGRNDPCPCGSGNKYKSCHLDKEGDPAWKLGSPTPSIRAVAVAQLIHSLSMEQLAQVPAQLASGMARAEMASIFYQNGEVTKAMELLKSVLDGSREEEFILYDYWIARYAEWLVAAGDFKAAESFLMDEFDHPKGVEPWQVAQKLAAFYIDQGDPDNAETWVETAMQGDPDNPFNHYLDGLIKHTMEQWDLAVDAYQKSRELSDRFREQEKAYMLELVNESLRLAQNHLPVDGPEEEEESSQDAAEPATGSP